MGASNVEKNAKNMMFVEKIEWLFLRYYYYLNCTFLKIFACCGSTWQKVVLLNHLYIPPSLVYYIQGAQAHLYMGSIAQKKIGL